MVNKIFSWVGLMLAVLVLGVSVMRSAEESAYAFVVSDDQRVVDENQSEGSWYGLKRLNNPGAPWYLTQMVFERLEVLVADDGVEKASLYTKLSEERMEKAEELMNQGDIESAFKTAAKGASYLHLGRQELEGEEAEAEWAELATASYYHEEVLTKLKDFGQDGEVEKMNSLCNEVLLLREKAEMELSDN